MVGRLVSLEIVELFSDFMFCVLECFKARNGQLEPGSSTEERSPKDYRRDW